MRQYGFEPVRYKDFHSALLRPSKSVKQETARGWCNEDKKRTALRLQTMISVLEREVTNLEMSILSELDLARLRDRACSAYLDSAKMMQSRRENLKTTIAGLTEKLAQLNSQTPHATVV